MQEYHKKLAYHLFRYAIISLPGRFSPALLASNGIETHKSAPSCEALQDFDYDTQPPASRLLLACFKQTLLPSRLSVSIFCTCANSLGNSSCFACEFSWYNRARQIYVHVPVLRELYDHVIFFTLLYSSPWYEEICIKMTHSNFKVKMYGNFIYEMLVYS